MNLLFPVVFILVVAAIFAAFVFFEIMMIRRSKGLWRILALLPGIALVTIILVIVVSILVDPTSHNLWPFEILMWSVGGLLYLVILLVVRKITTPKTG